jgi:4-carboxymuconolactone decarboxylase
MEATMGTWAKKTGFASRSSSGRFIGPFNPMLSSPEMASTFLQLQLDEAKFTGLSERVRQVVILSVGSVWRADYEL